MSERDAVEIVEDGSVDFYRSSFFTHLRDYILLRPLSDGVFIIFYVYAHFFVLARFVGADVNLYVFCVYRRERG